MVVSMWLVAGSKNDTKKAPAAKKTPATKRTPTARKAPAVAKKATAEVTLLDSDEDDEEMMRRALDESLNYQVHFRTDWF